jgi:aspartate-semialdehyde dehydrogenase
VKKLKAAILGATGTVGQRFIQMLHEHPWFEVSDLMGKTSAGRRYGEAVNWLWSPEVPEEIRGIEVKPSKPRNLDSNIVFSAIPADEARTVEPSFAEAGFPVVSNASAHRMDPTVPLIIPEVNSGHLGLIDGQREGKGWDGFIVTNPNCSAINLALVLKPIHDLLTIEKVIVTTMQAVSGAGYPGVPSLSITDNVIPFIEREEEKMVTETRKILGRLEGGRVIEASFPIAASCNRVPTIDGHLESVYIDAEGEVDIEGVKEALRNFRGRPQDLGLPSAPADPIIVREEMDRPQTRLDRMGGTVPGMSVSVGRLRHGVDDDSLQITLIGHNTIRGAAGTAVLIGELLLAEKLIGGG